MFNERRFADAFRPDDERVSAPRVQPPELRGFLFTANKWKRKFHFQNHKSNPSAKASNMASNT